MTILKPRRAYFGTGVALVLLGALATARLVTWLLNDSLAFIDPSFKAAFVAVALVAVLSLCGGSILLWKSRPPR